MTSHRLSIVLIVLIQWLQMDVSAAQKQYAVEQCLQYEKIFDTYVGMRLRLKNVLSRSLRYKPGMLDGHLPMKAAYIGSEDEIRPVWVDQGRACELVRGLPSFVNGDDLPKTAPKRASYIHGCGYLTLVAVTDEAEHELGRLKTALAEPQESVKLLDIHEGTPNGSFEELHGLRTYISKPEGGSKKKTVVFIPDIFGINLVNTQLVADEWAKNGFYVYVPDVFKGDAIDHKYLKTIIPNLRDQEKATLVTKAADTATMGAVFGPWAVRNREAVAKPVIEAFLKGVRADAETGKIGTVGFCWGGRYVLVFGQKDSAVKVDAAIANHPSLVSVPADVETVDIPTAILIGDKDTMMSADAAKEAHEVLKKSLGDKAYLKIYPNAVHGFTVRGDDMIEKEKKDKEDALKEGVAFFNKYLV